MSKSSKAKHDRGIENNPLERVISKVSKSNTVEESNSRSDSFSSRKKGRISTISSAVEDLGISDENLVEREGIEANHWKRKYQQLLQQSEVDAEQFETLISLQDEKIRLLEENVPISGNLSESVSLTKIIQLYETLTSMKVDYAPVNMMTQSPTSSSSTVTPDEFVCTLKNKIKRAATRFVIKLPGNGGNLEFIPKVNMDMLPQYVQGHISFEPNAAPVLMADMLAKLFEDIEDD
jgi:hypothetical protein